MLAKALSFNFFEKKLELGEFSGKKLTDDVEKVGLNCIIQKTFEKIGPRNNLIRDTLG